MTGAGFRKKFCHLQEVSFEMYFSEERQICMLGFNKGLNDIHLICKLKPNFFSSEFNFLSLKSDGRNLS